MKKMKYLFIMALAFTLFMVSVPVKADQAGPCSSKVCNIAIEKVDNLDSITIDLDRLSLSDGDLVYAISVSSKSGSTTYGTNFKFLISNFEGRDMSDIAKGYVPVAPAGQLSVTYTSNDLSIDQADTAWAYSGIDATQFFTIGYLVVGGENASLEFGIKFRDEFVSGSLSDLTLNGIEYNKTNDDGTINVDVLFGDFKFNYVVVNYYQDKPADGYWQPITNKGDMITIDNSNSTDVLFCNFVYNGNSKVSAFFNEYFPNQGDVAVEPSPGHTSKLFEVAASEKKTIRVQLYGGNENVAKEILDSNGTIGTIDLLITNNRDNIMG